MRSIKIFWGRILSSTDTFSSKRLVTLIISLHFIIASFAILFFAFYVIFYLPKGRVEPDLMELLKGVLEYDFYIILSGLGFISIDNMGQVMIERAKSKASIPDITQSEVNYGQMENPQPDPSDNTQE
jgi:hypothetical protein